MMLLMTLFAGLLPQAAPDYAASVSFDRGCIYWTGDVGMTAAEFRDDLRERFDRSGSITIFHGADVPKRCVTQAERMARAAGFRKVETQIGDPNLGPPIA